MAIKKKCCEKKSVAKKKCCEKKSVAKKKVLRKNTLPVVLCSPPLDYAGGVVMLAGHAAGMYHA